MKKNLFLVLVLSIAFIGSVIAQERTITGTVTSAEDGVTLPGVNAVVQGTNIGTITNMDGEYSIDVPADAEALEFSFVGMLTQTISIGTSSVIDVALEAGLQEMEEVVVTALGISREKKALGYAVTEVTGDELATVKETNMINSLAGRVAGVVLTQSSAGPGSGTRVVIRGNNSITGDNQPLYVVDGIPIDNSGFGSAAGSETANYRRDDYGTGISDINPDDIESVSVLKGPNAAALYGSRASNGVILITTKKGKMSKGLGVTLSHSTTFENPMVLPEFQNDYGQGNLGSYPNDLGLETLLTTGGSWGGKLDGSSQIYFTGENKPYKAYPDNVKDFFETGQTMINTIAVDGGTAKSTIRFSYTNNSAKGLIPDSKLTKHNFNLRGTTVIGDKLSLDSKITYFQQDASGRAIQGTEGIMANLYDMPRSVDVNDLKDYQDEADYSKISYTDQSGNPYWMAQHDVRKDSRNRFLGFVKAQYEITDFLSAHVRVGTDFVTHNIETIEQYGHHYYMDGRFNFSTRKVSETNADFMVMFNKELISDLDLSLNVGGNMMYQTYNSFGVSGQHFKIPTKPTVQSASETSPSYTPLREKRINSLYGAATLSFRNFVYLDLSGRNDWSSTLPEDNWSYFYPSASLAFVLNEIVDLSSAYIDFLKVRGSWAKVGGDTDPYQLDIAFDLAATENSYLGLIELTKPGTRLNPDLKPEQTTSIEAGLELRMLMNRVYFDASYYTIKSEDLIMDVPVSPSTGYSYYRSNIGQITNKGFEFILGGVPVQTNNLNWEISMNFSKNKNVLEELIEGLETFTFSSTNDGLASVRAKVGGGFGDIYGTDWLKTDDGRIIVDATGRPQATSDLVKLGNYQPDWVGGMTNNLRYKDLTLSILLEARIGGQLYSGTTRNLDGAGVTKASLKYREEGVLVDGVENTGTPEEPIYVENTHTITGQEYWGAVTGITSEYVFDQTNIRLREVALTYRLPSNLFDNIFIESVNLSLIGRNLFFLYSDMKDFDPVSSYSTSNFAQGMLFFNLPSTRSYGININVKF